MSIFEKASRAKIRFESPKGLLSSEDLWDLPLSASASKANLDDIARALFAKLKGDDNVSFVNKAQKSDEATQLAFDLVKHVIDTRLVENEAAETLRINKEKKQRILAIIEHKENEALGASSIEDLRSMLAGL
jgi:hypothetical protein